MGGAVPELCHALRLAQRIFRCSKRNAEGPTAKTTIDEARADTWGAIGRLAADALRKIQDVRIFEVGHLINPDAPEQQAGSKQEGQRKLSLDDLRRTALV